MAKVQGVKEKIHLPLYDAFFVPGPGMNNNPPAKTFSEVMTDPRMIRFFVDVQNKTQLETNLQSAGVLPSNNQYEAHALRLVVSDFKRFELKNPKIGVEVNKAEVVADILYNSVITVFVGEKVMMQGPTWLFPSGAGVYSPGNVTVANHGQPDPMATFRFAEKVTIDAQQNFRVEMLFPLGVPGQGSPPDPTRLAGILGPLHVWAMFDGFMIRDVQ